MIYDDRPDSVTEGEVVDLVFGEGNPMLIRISGKCWHGYEALGMEPSVVLNFPSALYEYYDPDVERPSAGTDEIPVAWHAHR